MTLTAPSADSTVGTTLKLAASASSSSGISRVEFWIDSTRLSSDAKAPYSARVSLPSSVSSGTHTLTARALDNAGGAASAAELVTVSRSSTRSRVRVAAVSGPTRGVIVATAAAGPNSTRVAGQAPQQRMLRVALTSCTDRRGGVADTARLRADAQGRIDGKRGRAGLCVLRLAFVS